MDGPTAAFTDGPTAAFTTNDAWLERVKPIIMKDGYWAATPSSGTKSFDNFDGGCGRTLIFHKDILLLGGVIKNKHQDIKNGPIGSHGFRMAWCIDEFERLD